MTRREVTREELRLWRAVLRDTTPLPGHGMPTAAEPAVASPQTPAAGEAEPSSSSSSLRHPPSPKINTTLPRLDPGHSPGLDRRNAERLRKGRMTIEATLDLHGLTQETAHLALIRFLRNAAEAERRCLLVVTGKGTGHESGGVLRTQVPRWLNEPEIRQGVLGFCHAQPKDGGDGALYVLLRRRR